MIVIDIIILSYAQKEYLKALTIQAIESLLLSEDPQKISFNIIVIESNKDMQPYQYPCTKTIYPKEKFGFNRYLNIGVRMTNNPLVCLCNNDLIFHKNWASEIIQAMTDDPLLMSANPYCPKFHEERGFPKYAKPQIGYDNGILIGWCIFVKRDIFQLIGELDENFEFWYCDSDYGKTLQSFGIKNCLISSSFVAHLGNESLNTLDQKTRNSLTYKQYLYYDYKWNHHSRLYFLINQFVFPIKSFVVNSLKTQKII